jgi:hypothetical protein
MPRKIAGSEIRRIELLIVARETPADLSSHHRLARTDRPGQEQVCNPLAGHMGTLSDRR